MKKNILFTIALISFGANAQQKLVGMTQRSFDETGVQTYIDSTDYTYTSWQGSITSNEPQFSFDSPVFDWLYELPEIPSNEVNVYNGVLSPQFAYSRQNTIVNGNITESEVAQGDRTVYTYDGSNNLTKIEYFFWNVSQFDIYAESIFEYDANNNLLVESYISDPTGNPSVESVDSMTYDASNNMTRVISYQIGTTSSLEPQSESFITYSGSEVDNLQLHQSNGTQLEWEYDLYYTYVGGLPTMIEAYPVTGGVPSTTVEIEIIYTTNADDQLSLYEVYFSGDLFVEQVYTYDTEGFVKKIENSDIDFATSSVFLSGVTDFYYQLTANSIELPDVTASVYPNPTNDFISIDSDAQIDRVTVLSTDGKVMIEQKGNNVDVSNLTSGVYLVNVMTSKGGGQTRFVKN
ncbi:MAG: T9SS type A sorting domain-containing protein [Crocinitomicaceae bacterium]